MSAPLGKRILDLEAVRRTVTALAALYMWFVHVTTRWEVEGGDIPRGFWERDEAFVLAVWHGRLLMVAPPWPRHRPLSALMSKHRDGELIARAVAWYGVGAVRGSSRGGDGAAALRQVVRCLKDGNSVAFAPDGPRGPRMRARQGVVTAARLSGAAVVPFAFASRRRRVLSSWDKFVLPLPFGRGVLAWGAPIRVPREAGDAAAAGALTEIEGALNHVTGLADRRCGHAPVEPAAAGG